METQKKTNVQKGSSESNVETGCFIEEALSTKQQKTARLKGGSEAMALLKAAKIRNSRCLCIEKALNKQGWRE